MTLSRNRIEWLEFYSLRMDDGGGEMRGCDKDAPLLFSCEGIDKIFMVSTKFDELPCLHGERGGKEWQRQPPFISQITTYPSDWHSYSPFPVAVRFGSIILCCTTALMRSGSDRGWAHNKDATKNKKSIFTQNEDFCLQLMAMMAIICYRYIGFGSIPFLDFFQCSRPSVTRKKRIYLPIERYLVSYSACWQRQWKIIK